MATPLTNSWRRLRVSEVKNTDITRLDSIDSILLVIHAILQHFVLLCYDDSATDNVECPGYLLRYYLLCCLSGEINNYYFFIFYQMSPWYSKDPKG